MACCQSTAPRGLLTRHNTKAGTWGLIHVESGVVRYTIFRERDNQEDEVIDVLPGTPGDTRSRPARCSALTCRIAPGVIVPQEWHKVEPLTDGTIPVV